MQAVIMAGGYGTRLQTLTHDVIPKPMIEICGKPLLQWQIENLKANGFDDIIVVVGYLGDQILDKFGGTVCYYEEDEPLGTAGALPQIADMLEDNFFLIYGDLFFNIDFQRMMKFHRDHCGHGTVLTHPTSHMFDSDLVICKHTFLIEDIVPKIEDRPWWLHNQSMSGIYVFNKSILKIFPQRPKLDLEEDILPLLHYLYSYKSTEYVKDIGTVERFHQVEADIKNGVPIARSLKNKQKAIFLDRDGTINYKDDLISDPTKFEIFPYAAEAIRKINQSGYLTIIVTNQPVIARGKCSFDMLDMIHAKMETLLGREGAYLDDIYFCPHHPDKGFPEENRRYKVDCDCRKPKPGMFYKAAERYNIDLSQSWMIGDTEIDRQAAINAGVKPIITDNLLDAVNSILGE